MAITKIRKISSWTLWIVAAISIAVLALFFFGGQGETMLAASSGDALNNPKFTSELLYWVYTMMALAILALLCFGLFQFVTSLMMNPKKALASLSVIVVFGVLLGATYAMGDGTPLSGINADSAEYNVPFWLKVTDMWLYTMYTLGVLCILATLAGSLKSIFNR
jgi:uncharacterized membrane protein